MRHLETLLLALSAGGFLVRANLVQELSFAAPFSSFESDGSRRVSPHFRVYGHAVVNENFVRLTPDRQSKRGALWSRMEIATQSFSTTLRFRISGSGKKFFGDGIALWITHNTRYNPGDLHGVNPKFVGVGIVFDTFRNTEALDKHRDVALLVNDGTKTVDDMYEVVQGCDAAVRVWEQRADFDVSKAARAKVEIVGREVRVQVDEKEDGNWEECIRTTLPDTIPEAWLKSAHVGVTASTGQLADNHDVLSLQSFSELEKARLHERMEDEKTFFETDPAAPVDERLSLVEETLNQILSRLDVNEHALEHKIVGVEDHIKSIVMKIETREDQAEVRLVVSGAPTPPTGLPSLSESLGPFLPCLAT